MVSFSQHNTNFENNVKNEFIIIWYGNVKCSWTLQTSRMWFIFHFSCCLKMFKNLISVVFHKMDYLGSGFGAGKWDLASPVFISFPHGLPLTPAPFNNYWKLMTGPQNCRFEFKFRAESKKLFKESLHPENSHCAQRQVISFYPSFPYHPSGDAFRN